jgi:C_GCAxxG_C_C family probable redox protein
MDDTDVRMMELSLQGFGCSQILALMALEGQGKTNPDLVRAMTGLLGGMFRGKACGALTGGCCVLGLFAGNGDESEIADSRLEPMMTAFTEWFDAEVGERYGGIDCDAILAEDPALRRTRCPEIVRQAFRKLVEILEDNDYHLNGHG